MALMRTDSSASLASMASTASTSALPLKARRRARQYGQERPAPSRRPSMMRRESSPPAISQNDAEWLAGMMELLDDVEKDAASAKECKLNSKGTDVMADVVLSMLVYIGQWMLDKWCPQQS